MLSENLDIDSIMDARRKAVAESIRQISTEELKALGETLFTYPTHPWRETFRRFIDENAASTIYHATTNDRIQVVYCHDKEKGIWFIPGSATGIMQKRGLTIMKEVVDAR
jgi:hypothetical protein